MITVLEVLGALRLILVFLLCFAGIRAYSRRPDSFYLFFAIAFFLTSTSEVFAGIIVHYISQGAFGFQTFLDALAFTQTEFMGMVPMTLILAGLLLRLLQGQK